MSAPPKELRGGEETKLVIYVWGFLYLEIIDPILSSSLVALFSPDGEGVVHS